MSEQENVITVTEDDVEVSNEKPSTETKDGSSYIIDKETVETIEKAFVTARKAFFQSAIIRAGVVLVALKVVTVTGNIVAERLRENKKSEEK